MPDADALLNGLGVLGGGGLLGCGGGGGLDEAGLEGAGGPALRR
jgi:hypothetical protein